MLSGALRPQRTEGGVDWWKKLTARCWTPRGGEEEHIREERGGARDDRAFALTHEAVGKKEKS